MRETLSYPQIDTVELSLGQSAHICNSYTILSISMSNLPICGGPHCNFCTQEAKMSIACGGQARVNTKIMSQKNNGG